MKLTWGNGSSATVSSVEEFDTLLDALAKQAEGQGLIVQPGHANGRTLAIVLGRTESVLTYFDENSNSFTSVGDRSREDYLSFEFGGDISEMMGAKAVPEGKARAAARQFFESGELSKLLEWEKEWT